MDNLLILVMSLSVSAGATSKNAVKTAGFFTDLQSGPTICCTEKVIYVPHITMQRKRICCIEHRPEVTMKTEPVTKKIPRTETKMECTVRLGEKTCRQQVCRQVPAPEEHSYTVCYTEMVPYKDVEYGVRKVTRKVPVVQRKIVCVDEGHWEPCGCTCQCTHCRSGHCCGRCSRKRWVPNMVHKEVACTVMQTKCFDEPYECEVTKWRPEVKQRTLTMREYGHVDIKTEEREFKFLVPQNVRQPVTTPKFDCFCQCETRPHVELVPCRVEKEIDVPVCKMVPVTIRVPSCCRQ